MAVLAIAPERPDQPDILALLEQSDAHSAERYPAESRHMVDAAVLARPDVRFLVARLDGRTVGCGALLLGTDGSAELKRMIVDGAARGQGVGRALLAALEAAAGAARVRIMRLETGILNHDALGLYRTAGFHQRGPFGSYAEDTLSVFMQKDLAR